MRLSQILCLIMAVGGFAIFLCIIDTARKERWKLDWDSVAFTGVTVAFTAIMLAGAFW